MLRLALLAAALAAASPALAQSAIEVGVELSATGAQANVSKLIHDGYEMGVRQINRAGGVKLADKALPFELVWADDRSNVEDARAAAERLIAGGVPFLLGPFGSELNDAVAAVAEERGVPLVAGGSGRYLFEAGRRWLFGLSSTNERYLSGAVALIGERALETGRDPAQIRLALLFAPDDGTQDIRAGVVEEAQRWRMQVAADESLPPTSNDISAQIERIALARPDLLLVSAHRRGGLLAGRALAKREIYVPMVAVTHCDAADLANALKGAAEHILCATQWDRFLSYKDIWFQTANDYAVTFELEFGYAPPYQAAQATASVLVLADAIARAGSLDREAVREALKRTDLMTMFGPVRFDAKGRNVGKPMLLYQVQQGEYRVVSPLRWAWSELIYPAPEQGRH
jgi:branched-chain amino acid transport system substrate-binding protein